MPISPLHIACHGCTEGTLQLSLLPCSLSVDWLLCLSLRNGMVAFVCIYTQVGRGGTVRMPWVAVWQLCGCVVYVYMYVRVSLFVLWQGFGFECACPALHCFENWPIWIWATLMLRCWAWLPNTLFIEFHCLFRECYGGRFRDIPPVVEPTDACWTPAFRTTLTAKLLSFPN